MAAFVVQVHNIVDKVIRTSRRSGKDTNEKIGGELMQLTRAVVEKHTLSPVPSCRIFMNVVTISLALDENLIVHVLGQ